MEDKDKKIKGWIDADLDWWYGRDDEDFAFCDNGEEEFDAYINDDSRYTEFTIKPLNNGTRLDFLFLFNKDLGGSGSIDKGTITLSKNNEKIADYPLGDITIDTLVLFGLSLLKTFEPRLAPTNEKIKEWLNRHEKQILEKE